MLFFLHHGRLNHQGGTCAVRFTDGNHEPLGCEGVSIDFVLALFDVFKRSTAIKQVRSVREVVIENCVPREMFFLPSRPICLVKPNACIDCMYALIETMRQHGNAVDTCPLSSSIDVLFTRCQLAFVRQPPKTPAC